MPASRRIPTYRRAARSDTPSRVPRSSPVMPGLFWIASSASNARAVGLSSTGIAFPEVDRPGWIVASSPMELLTEPPVAGGELDTLLGTLERTRRLIAWKCGGLDAAAMATTVGKSPVTLGGLVRHLTRVEELSFSSKLHGHQPTGTADDWDRDWAWTAADDPDETWRQWRA